MAFFENARWLDALNTEVYCEMDGLPTTIPVGHSLYKNLVDEGVPISEYVATVLDATTQLQATDRDFVRVGEDIIEALFTKGILSKADLPQKSVDKMNARRVLRGQSPL